jgi:hypothetical protein
MHESIIIIVFSVSIIVLASYEAWVINTNYDAKNECYKIWQNIIFNCVINWVLLFIFLISLTAAYCCTHIESNNNTFSSLFIIGFMLTNTLSHSWTMYIEKHISDKCLDKYSDEYPHLLKTFELEVTLFYIYVIFTSVSIFFSLIYFIFYKKIHR